MEQLPLIIEIGPNLAKSIFLAVGMICTAYVIRVVFS